ncbi:MAG: TonB-dependent receptor [Bryobacteraceae bacterium]
MLSRVSFLCVFMSMCLWSQEFRAGIVGTVTDPSGAVVPGCDVTVVNVGTNLASTTVTTGAGFYSVSFLPPGAYRLEVRCKGFRGYVQESIALQIGDKPTIDVKVQPGEVSSTVTVNAEAPLLETSSASRGEVLSQHVVESMPLNGRNVLMDMLLTPGIVFTNRGSGNAFIRTTSFDGMTGVSLSGGQPRFNEVLLDGVPDTGGNGTIHYAPSVEATQEMKVQTNSFDAEYGRFTGGIINVAVKSGSNDFHGSLYDFFRNAKLNARDPFATNKPQFGYNLFGGTVGGPVYLPKLYNGKDKTFFFFNYEGSREGVARSTSYTVPTVLQRGGDFSETKVLSGGVGVPITVYDPSTTRLSGTAYVRDPFPNNRIPSDRLNTVARNAIAYYPQPNATGVAVTGGNNWHMDYRDPVLDNGIVARIDQRLSNNNQIFGRYSWRHSYVGANLINPLNAINAADNDRWTNGVAIDDIYTVSPTMFVDIRYGFSRLYQYNPSLSIGFDATTLGLPKSYVQDLDVKVFPIFNTTGYTALSRTPMARSAYDSHSLLGSITKIIGSHSMKFGGQVRVLRENQAGPSSTAGGSFSFNSTFTRGPNPQKSSTTGGHALASFLLGLPASGTIGKAALTAGQVPYYDLYFQDDWRVTSRLTINLGLRYEWEGANTERFNRSNRGFDFASDSPIAAAARAAYAASPIDEVSAANFQVRGGLQFAGIGGQSRSLTNSDFNNISPRIGVAYQFLPKTVLRGGYGIFYAGTSNFATLSQGFSQSTSMVATNDGGLTAVDDLSNPFPNGILQPNGSSLGLMTYVGQGASYIDVDRKTPRAHQYQFGIQHELPGGLLVDAAYAGSTTKVLPVDVGLNFVPVSIHDSARATYKSTGRNTLNDSVANPFYGLIGSGNLSGKTVTRSQLLYAYPQYTSLVALDEGIGSSRYDSFQVKATKRLSSGFSLQVSYTAAKNLEQDSYLNTGDANLVKQLVDYDIPQRLTASGTWQLPIGPGKTLLKGSHGWLSRLAEGWQLNVIYSAQSGIPITISTCESTGTSAKLAENERTPSAWFNTAAFRVRETLEYTATALLPDVRTNGKNNFDVSLFKTTTIREQMKLQFRMESFNALNHPEYFTPGTTYGSSTFGVVSAVNNLSRQIQLALRLSW